VLQTLDLNNMLISLLDDFTFDGMLLLSNLNLSSNHITYLSTQAFFGLSRHLRYLDLSRNPLFSINTEVFQHLYSLQWIAMNESKFCCYANQAEVCLPENNDIFFTCGDILQNSLLKGTSWFVGSLAFLLNIFVIYFNFKAKRLSSLTLLIISLSLSDLLMGFYFINIGIHRFPFSWCAQYVL